MAVWFKEEEERCPNCGWNTFVEEELFMIVDGKKIFYDTAIVCSKCRNTFKWGTVHEQSTKNNQDI